MRMIARWFASLLVAAAFITHAAAQDKVPVVASFSIIADLVKQVGGDRIEVSSIVPANADMHAFQREDGRWRDVRPGHHEIGREGHDFLRRSGGDAEAIRDLERNRRGGRVL
jgi:hypothetical protein